MRRAARTDANHAEIREAFRALGCSVVDLSRVGAGCPDLLVGHGGENWLIEVKTEKGELTADQIKFRDAWRGHWYVVRSVDEVVKLV